MTQNRIFFLLIFFSIITTLVAQSKISLKTKEVEEGIYNLILQKRFSTLTYLGGLRTSREKYGYSRLNFKITYVNKLDKTYFNIYHVHTGQYIGVRKDNSVTDPENLQVIVNNNIIKNNNNIISFDWEFIKEEGRVNSFIVKNKVGCVLRELKNRIICSLKEEGTLFSLLRLYQEVNKIMSEEDKKILEDEPIDVFIKFIDLSDPKLKRKNLKQIKKDKENEELRYSVRSILQNLPWIRKIFILMPNEKVRFFKNYTEINEKIVYVKDSDVLGHESANIHAFQYRIWKLREFGLSENFISMDDDYFIGKPMNKSDFFYVENKKVYPAIINSKFEVQTINTAQSECNSFKKKTEKNKRVQTSDEFMYMVFRTYIFLIEYFDSPIIVPYFTHNAIPVNTNDLKEVFDLVNKSEEFAEPTLYALKRNKKSLQYQTTLIVYSFNQYRRRVNKINYNYIDGASTIQGNYNYPLFCINTGNNNDYSKYAFMKMKVSMEYLFPIPTKYEIYNPKILAEDAYYAARALKNDLKKITEQKKIDEYRKELYENTKISRKFEEYQNQLQFTKSENIAYKAQIKKIDSTIELCESECDKRNQKVSELQSANYNYGIIHNIKKEINIINGEINKYEKKINNYLAKNQIYLDKIKNKQLNEKRMNRIIYLQLLVIIFVIICISYVVLKNNDDRYINSAVYGYNSFT